MFKPLLSAVAAGLLLGPASPCHAADPGNATAYAALHTMAKSLGADTLNHVVEVSGRAGAPQPATWRIVILDPTKGAREVKVTGDRTVSQGASGDVASLQPIRLTDLNLDSSGAFNAADVQARKAKVPFSSLNYSLRVNAATGKPVWDLELLNDARSGVGTVRVAAHDGNLLAVNGLTPAQATPPRPPALASNGDHDTVRPAPVRPSRSGATTTTTTTTYNTVQPGLPPPGDEEDRRNAARSPSEGGFFSRVGRTLDHTSGTVSDSVNRAGESVNHTVQRTGTTLQRFFTGRSNQDQSNTPAQ